MEQDLVESLDKSREREIYKGRLLPVFIRYSLPSMLGLFALTTASLVDGFFVGHYVGRDALAAINLIIPLLTLFFATVITLAIGGSVRAGHLLGDGNVTEASDVFSLCLIIGLIISTIYLMVVLLFSPFFLALVNTPESLMAFLIPYLRILVWGLPLQFVGVVVYYFLRTSGFPQKATAALVIGAIVNIILDVLLVGVFKFGIKGAAAATVISQALQCTLLVFWFYRGSELSLRLTAIKYRHLPHVLANGASEFIHEISAGLVIGTINFIAITKMGVQGVAAYAVVNYIQFAYLMLCYGFIDALHVLVSKNYGAGQLKRAFKFYVMAITCITGVGSLVLALIVFKFEVIARSFLPDSTIAQINMSKDFVYLIWPFFLLAGINIASCAFLTATGRAIASAIYSALRSLLLPVGCLVLLGLIIGVDNFLLALPLAEGIVVIGIVVLAFVTSKRDRVLFKKQS